MRMLSWSPSDGVLFLIVLNKLRGDLLTFISIKKSVLTLCFLLTAFISSLKLRQHKVQSTPAFYISCDLCTSGLIVISRWVKIGSPGTLHWAEHDSFPFVYLAPDVIEDIYYLSYIRWDRVASWEQLALHPHNKVK